MMTKTLFFIAAVGGFFSVALGAFGAHVLETLLTDKQLSTYQTATFYLTIHSLALFMVALLQLQKQSHWFYKGAWLMVVGTLLFSGSLYTLVATGFPMIGLVTPIGGTALLLSWLVLAIGALKLPIQPDE